MKKNILIFILILSSQFSFSQNFELIDKKVRNYPEYKNLNSVFIRVNNDFKTDVEKVRAFYIWITSNITYNLKALDKPRAIDFTLYRTLSEYQSQKREKELRKIRKIIREKKALCYGFSLIFQELCTLSKIESKIIQGVTKVSANEIFNSRNTKDHAWNVVKINNKWELLDITWSSGYVDAISKLWVNQLDDFYYFTAPEHFLTSHYPQHKKWQLVTNHIDLEAFFAKPIFYSKYFDSGLILNSHQNGLITFSKKKNVIIFKMNTEIQTNKLFYSNSDNNLLRPLNTKIVNDNTLVAILKGHMSKKEALTIYLNTEPIIEFKIKK